MGVAQMVYITPIAYIWQHGISAFIDAQRVRRLWMNSRQTLPYKIWEELPVIQAQSREALIGCEGVTSTVS